MASMFTKPEQLEKIGTVYIELTPILRSALNESSDSVKWNSDNIDAIERIIESKVLGNHDGLAKPNDSPAGSNSTDQIPPIQPEAQQGSGSSTTSTDDPHASNSPHDGSGSSSANPNGSAGTNDPSGSTQGTDNPNGTPNTSNNPDNPNGSPNNTNPNGGTAPLTAERAGFAALNGTTIAIIAGCLVGAAVLGVAFVRLLTRNQRSHDPLPIRSGLT